MSPKHQEFSTGWVIASIFIFMAVELFFGGFIGEVVLGAYVSPMWHIKMQLLLNLTAFLVGGFLVGFFSPGLRMIEPAIGGFLSVILVGMMGYFMPYSFIGFHDMSLFIGGVIGFGLALMGAYTGEKMMRNVD
jgi:hypothetical protein